MSSPLIFDRDGRTLSWWPVTTAAMDAIAAVSPPRRLAYARSLYCAVLQLANERRGSGGIMHARVLGERAGMGRELVGELRLVLEKAGVVEVHERHAQHEQLTLEWVAVDPGDVDVQSGAATPPVAGSDTPLSGAATPPVAGSDTPRGRVTSAVKTEDERKTEDATHPLSSASRVDAADAQTVRDLFGYWRQACNHPNAHFVAKRRRAIAARLREGYSEQDVRQAIDGAARAPFVKDGRTYDDVELICRDGPRLERHMQSAGAGAASPAGDARALWGPTDNKYDRAAGLL